MASVAEQITSRQGNIRDILTFRQQNRPFGKAPLFLPVCPSIMQTTTETERPGAGFKPINRVKERKVTDMKKSLFALLTALALILCVSIACADTYTMQFDATADLDEVPFAEQVNGGHAGGGILPIDSWGMKKFALDDEGEVAGTGVKYDVALTVEDGAYTFVLTINLVGNNEEGGYVGEGALVYTWTGAAEEGEDGIVLSAADFGSVEVTGSIAPQMEQFSNFLPEAPYKTDSTVDGELAGKTRIVSNYLAAIFGGTTVVVDGEEIEEFVDTEYFEDWDSLFVIPEQG